MRKALKILSIILCCCPLLACGQQMPNTSESSIPPTGDEHTATSVATTQSATTTEASAPLTTATKRLTTTAKQTTAATKAQNSGLSTPITKSFSPLPYQQSALLWENPSRGWRTHLYWNVGWALDPQKLLEVSAQYGKRWENRYDYWENQKRHFFNTGSDYTSTAFVYIYLTEYHDNPVIPQEALDCIEEFFAYVRKEGFTMLLDFCYCDDLNDLSTCADEKIMLAHMRQLAPIVKRNADVVHCIKAGFSGAYGEWAYQEPAIDYARVTKGILQNFCKSTGLQYLARLPKYKNSIGTNNEFYSRIGFSNDAIYGEQTRKGWESGGFQVGTDAWEQVCREGAYAPNDGEMCANGSMLNYRDEETGKLGIIPYGIDVIAEAAHHWFCTMSVWHGNYDYNSSLDSVRIMDTWRLQEVTPQLLKERKVVYDPSWFKDADGSVGYRDCYEFLKDHLGYRIELQNVKLDTNGKVTLRLKNYGMSAAFRMNSGFAVLDENHRVVSTLPAGKPEEWYSHDPNNWQDTQVLTHTVEGTVSLPQKAGKYYLAFYLKNDIDKYAYTSNAMECVNGYHILCDFTI